MKYNSTLADSASAENSSSKKSDYQPKYPKPHMIIPIEDSDWVLEQLPSVQRLWLECWKSDPYGSRWMQLSTQLKRSAFMAAKKILESAGLFKFCPKKSIKDTRETEYWTVINLHGSRRTSWKQPKAYVKFLEGAYWKQVRKQVLARDTYKCQQCGSRTGLQVHHLTYKHHRQEHEHLDDLVTLCRNCHEKEHS